MKRGVAVVLAILVLIVLLALVAVFQILAMRVVARNWQDWSRGRLAFVGALLVPGALATLWLVGYVSLLISDSNDSLDDAPQRALGAGLLLVAVMALLSLPSGLIAGWRAGASAAKRRSSLLDPFE